MANIGVLGGSFDPVHNSHLEMANQAISEFNLDVVVFVPAYLPPHKKSLSVSDEHRFNMLSLSLEDTNKFLIDKFEINRKSVIYTYQTLDYLQSKYDKDSITLIIGSDTFNQLNTWQKPGYIAKRYGFIVMQRANIIIDSESIYYKYASVSNFVMKDISSTSIRDILKVNQNIEEMNLIPYKVVKYIKKNGLYKK